MRLQMEQLENILALRVRLSNGALVEIPRENPLIMMPAHEGDVLVVRLVETSGVLRTLSEVEPAHDAVVVVESNHIHWCMVTGDEIAAFVEENEGCVVQNDNLFLRRALRDEQTLRITLPYQATDSGLTVAEVECELSIDPASGALLSSDRRGRVGRNVSARLLFVTHLQRDSAMWKRENVNAVFKRGTVRSDVSNEDALRRILSPQQVAPPEPVKTTSAPQKTVAIPIPSKYATATLQMDEELFNGISDMRILPDGTHLVGVEDGKEVDVSPLVWHAIDAARKGGDVSPEAAEIEINETFSTPGFAEVTIAEAALLFEGLDFGYISFDRSEFVLVTNEFDMNRADDADTKISVPGFDFYVMVALAGMNSYGTVFIKPQLIADRRVSFAKRSLKITGFGSVFSASIPADAANRLIEDIRVLNTSS